MKCRIILMLCMLLCIQQLFSQELIYQVYQFETPYQGHVVLKSHDTYIAKSNLTNDYFDKTISNKDLYGHSFEAEIGLLDHLELSAYADFETPDGKNFSYTQSHFSLLYRFKERFDNFVNIGLYGEYYFPRKAISNSQEAELRLILDKDISDFRLVANPSISRYTTGGESRKINPGLNAAIYYRRFFAVQPGIEYYEDFNAHTAVIFPTLDVHFTPGISLNAGAGFGLSNESDKLIFKTNLAFDIQAIRPSKLFRKPYHK